MELNEIITDKNKEEEGVWIRASDTSEIKIARAGNKEFVKYMEALMKPYKAHRMANRDIPEAVKTEISIKVLARTVIKDWKGFTENGVEYPYTEQNAIRLLTESRDFADFVSTLAQEASEFKKQALEAAAKN